MGSLSPGSAPPSRPGARYYAGLLTSPQPQASSGPASTLSTHLSLGPAAHVLRLGLGDGHAGLTAAPQPVATLFGPRALGPPGASAGAGGTRQPSGWGGTPRPRLGPSPPDSRVLTVPRRRTSRNRGPGSCGSGRRWKSSHTPARGAGTPGGTGAVSGTTATTGVRPAATKDLAQTPDLPGIASLILPLPLSLRSLNTTRGWAVRAPGSSGWPGSVGPGREAGPDPGSGGAGSQGPCPPPSELTEAAWGPSPPCLHLGKAHLEH